MASATSHHVGVGVAGTVVGWGAAAGDGLTDHGVAGDDDRPASLLHDDVDHHPDLPRHVVGDRRRGKAPPGLQVAVGPGAVAVTGHEPEIRLLPPPGSVPPPARHFPYYLNQRKNTPIRQKVTVKIICHPKPTVGPAAPVHQA